MIAHLLDSTEERRIAVIVNDLAPESLDAAFLNGGEHIRMEDTGLIRSLPGGRAGAGKEEALVAKIQELAALDPPPEAILLETSGSSPAGSLRHLFQTDPRLKELCTLAAIVTVVDASTLVTWWNDPQLQPLLRDQLSGADVVVFNKYDRATWVARVRARAIVRRTTRARKAEILPAEFGRVDPQVILTAPQHHREEPAAVHQPPGRPFHQPLVARHLDDRRPFHPERLEAWLNNPWEGIIRVKGFFWLATDMTSVYVVDGAGPQREVGLEGTWYASLDPSEVPADTDVQEALAAGPYQDRRQAVTVIGVPDAVEREMRTLRAALLSATEMDRGARGWADLPDPISIRFSPDNEPSPPDDQ